MANKHLEHLEDFILDDNKAFIDNFMIAGSTQPTEFSLKWDGAPAIVFGICPVSHQFFLSTKSIFNKTPIVFYNIKDIWRKHKLRPDLFMKLAHAFDVLEQEYRLLPGYPDLPIYQADLLFITEDVRNDMAEKYGDYDENFEFQPNTVKYSLVGEQIALAGKSDIGIAIHTEYFVNRVNLQDMNTWESAPVFRVPDFTNKVYLGHTSFTMPTNEWPLLMISHTLHQAAYHLLDVPDDTALMDSYRIAYNEVIKQGIRIPDDQFEHMFYGYWKASVLRRMTSKMANKKRASTMKTVADAHCALLQSMETHKQALASIYKYQCAVRAIKHNILLKMETRINRVVRTDIGHEGLVWTSAYGSTKLVQRDKFSAANFTKNGTTFEQK